MGLSKCRDCGNQISSRATTCPKCGSPRSKTNVLSALIGLTFLGIIIFAAVQGGAEQPTPTVKPKASIESVKKDVPKAPELDAKTKDDLLAMKLISFAQESVKKNLKSPATARFPGEIIERGEYKLYASTNGTTYQVRSWVDSQNGFGALIRSRWDVKISKFGDTLETAEVTIR